MSYSFPILEPPLLYTQEHVSTISKTAHTFSLPSAFPTFLLMEPGSPLRVAGLQHSQVGRSPSPMPYSRETSRCPPGSSGLPPHCLLCLLPSNPPPPLFVISHTARIIARATYRPPPSLHDGIDCAFYFLISWVLADPGGAVPPWGS